MLPTIGDLCARAAVVLRGAAARRPRRSAAVGALALLLAPAVGHTKSPPRPKYYVSLHAVKEPAKAHCQLSGHVRKQTLERLKAHPLILTKLGDGKLEGAALASELKKRKLTGYSIDVRITKCKHELLPRRPGKKYKVLMVEVTAAIDAMKLPSSQMALAGSGNAQVGTEVFRIRPKELAQLRREAATEALEQALKRYLGKMKGHKRRRRRRRRRRRHR